MNPKVKIEISARHLHLSRPDLEKLFGRGQRLKSKMPLSQAGEFAAWETVTLFNKNFKLEKVRVIGPIRPKSQAEITLTEARHFKINVPVRVSGDTKNSASLWLRGPRGRVLLKSGVIVAQRHLHVSSREAKKFRLKNGQRVSVKVAGPRGLTFDNVIVRVKPSFCFRLHIDTDEANAAGLKGGECGEVIT